MPNGRASRGLTLLELMIAVAIISILVGLAGPPFRDLVRNNRLSAQASDLQRALVLARAEAMTRATQVTLCASKNQETCGLSTDWAQGWIVFVTETVVPATTPPTTQTRVLLARQALEGGNTVVAAGFGAQIAFVGTGFVLAVGGIAQTGSLTICSGASRGRRVSVSAAGLTEIATITSNCPTS